jgi:hypothetical protein
LNAEDAWIDVGELGAEGTRNWVQSGNVNIMIIHIWHDFFRTKFGGAMADIDEHHGITHRYNIYRNMMQSWTFGEV